MKDKSVELIASPRSFCAVTNQTRRISFKKRFSPSALLLALAGWFLCLINTSLALDPGQPLGQYRMVRWDEDQGLPQNYTSNIAQTRDGFMWLAFDHGLIRFDGKNFALEDEIHANIKLPSKVFGLVPGSSGELWIGSYKALYCRLATGEFKRFDSKDGLPDDYLVALFLDSEGTLWIGTDNHGLFQLKDGHFRTCRGSPELGQQYIYAMCETSERSLWIGTAMGAYRLNQTSGEIKKFTQSDGLPANQVYGITTDREGRVWAGTGKGLARFDGKGRFQAVTNELRSQPIQSLMTDSHGMIWVSGSGSGFWRIDPETGNVSELPPENGGPVPDIRCVYEDREANIWLATSIGLERLSDVKFTTYTTRDGLPSDQITAVTTGTSNRIWIGTLNGLTGLNDGRVEPIAVATNDQTTPRSTVTSLHEDPRGVLWFGLQDATLHRLDQGHQQQIATLNESQHSGPGWATGMIDDGNGDLWVGTIGAGLQRFRNDQLVNTYTPKDGLQDSIVCSFAFDHDQRLWIGEGEGVDVLQESGIKAASSGNAPPVPLGVLALHVDADGTVWAGTGNGLFRLKNGRWAPVVYRPDQRVLGPDFNCLLEDDHGNFWSSGSHGIFFVSKHELNDFFDGKRSSVNCQAFGKADGLRSSECTRGFPAGCRSRDGRLWFATTAGLVVIDPNHLRFNSLPPPVQIEKLVVDLTDVLPVRPGGPSIGLCPGAHSLEIDYAGLSFSAPEKVRFRYKLEGFDKNWIDASTRREAYYTNLAPGTYRFKVIACNNDGLWLPEQSAAVTTLVVRPHFYQTFWFSALCAGALAIAIWLLWRWRLQQILEERTRLSRELHDTAARGIVALIWQIEGAKTAAKKRCFDTLLLNLDDSSKLARESLRETRRAVRALRSEVFDYDCSLASALEKVLNKAVEGTRLRTELNVSGTPYPTGRTWEQALLRITQESLTNTLKYARAQRFEVQICYSPSEVRLQLRDDGIGFDYKPGGEITAPQESWVSGGLGLLGIEERARQLGGRIQVESSPNNGTTIRVIVPRQSPIWRWLSVLGRRRRYAGS